MTFTYDPEQAGAQGKDRVRFRIGDTDPEAARGKRLEDEEIEATVAAQSSFSEAMAQCAVALAAKLKLSPTSKQAASVKITYTDRVKFLLDLAKEIRSSADSIAATDIVITGTTKSELAASAADTDLVQDAFRRGQFDNPDACAGSLEVRQ
jgi:hypothetical protein